MKKNFLIVFLVFFSFSCNKILKENEDNTLNESDKEYHVGGDEDKFGCVESAGYTWSVLKNSCIRVFEVGYRLNSFKQSEDEPNVWSAFIVFNELKDKVEVFLPNTEQSIILNQVGENKYEYKEFIFDKKEFVLYINRIKTYEAALEDLKNIDGSQDEIEID